VANFTDFKSSLSVRQMVPRQAENHNV